MQSILFGGFRQEQDLVASSTTISTRHVAGLDEFAGFGFDMEEVVRGLDRFWVESSLLLK